MNVDVAQIVQLVGALLLLSAFVLSQRNVLEPRSYPYILLNLVGGAILTVLAIQNQRLGFVLLEGVWTIVAFGGLIQRLTGKAPAPSH